MQFKNWILAFRGGKHGDSKIPASLDSGFAEMVTRLRMARAVSV